MGIAVSREFGIEIDEGVDLESILKNPKVLCHNVFSRAGVADFIQNLSRWKLFYEQLPLKSQRSIRKITSRQKEDSLSKVQRVQKSDIGISKKFRPHFHLWRNPKRFLYSKSPVAAKAPAQDTVSQVYVELRRIVDRRVDDPIRGRIYAVALFDLRLLLDETDSLHLGPEVREKIEQVIFDSPLVADSLEDVSRWTKMFLRFGERMKAIAARNGGFGALIVIPSSLLSMRQWCRISDVEFDQAVQHLESIKVAKIAKKENAHGVARRIHGLILQKFTSGTVDKLDADYDEHMADEEDEEEVEESNEDSTEDEDISDDDDGSSVANQSALTKVTSIDSSLGASADQAASPLELGQQMMVGNPTCPPRLARELFTEHAIGTSNISPLEFLSEAASLAYQQNGQQTQDLNHISTAPTTDTLPSPFPSNYVGPGQLRDFGTKSNPTSMNTSNDPSTPVTFPCAAPFNPGGYNLWNSYIAPDGTQVNPTEDNLWNSYITPDGTLVNPTEDNLWSSYIAPDGTLIDLTRDNLWNSYIAPDGTLVNPPVYIAGPSY